MTPSQPDPVAAELAALRQRLDALTAAQKDLEQRLAASETARRDLFDQAEHLVHLLDLARRELRELKGEAAR